jgi:uncharacterized protein YndB with AHSA1/START domain
VTEPIEIEFEVACSPEHAFDTWANRTSMWWPPSHSMSSAPGLVVTFEPRPGGRIYERTPEGTEHDWGEVLAWEPPRHLAYLWHLGTDRGRATEVDISFTGHAAATTVTIVHRGWERLGADAPRLARPQPRWLERPPAPLPPGDRFLSAGRGRPGPAAGGSPGGGA